MFIVEACSTEKVESWAKHVFRRMVQANIGRILSTVFTSSTCWVVQFSDGFWFCVVVAAALFRNLRVWVGGDDDDVCLFGFGALVEGHVPKLVTALVDVFLLL